MSTVFDASVLVKLVVPEEDTELAEALFANAPQAIAPDWAGIEVAQTLWYKSLRRELSPEQALACNATFESTPVDFVPAAQLVDTALDIGLAHRHSVYDCLYIATAIAEQASLVTADAKLATVAERCGVEVTLLRRLD